MMTAKDILSVNKIETSGERYPQVEADMHLLDVLPRLLDSDKGKVRVTEEGENLGFIDTDSMLSGLGRMLAARDDCSVITVECDPRDYSASVLAHAVEDSDAHLVDLFTVPAENGHLMVTLRVRHSDPTAAVRSLERYGFEVTGSHTASGSIQSLEIATERLLSLQALMNV